MTTSAQVANQPKPTAKLALAIRLALLLLAAVVGLILVKQADRAPEAAHPQ